MTDDPNVKPSGQSEEINNPDPQPRTPRPRKAASAPPSQAQRPSWTQCRDDCVRPTPTQAHCPVDGCHRTFGGVSNFDKHRRDGYCTDPATLGMVLNDAGVWRVPLAESEQHWWRSK